MKKTLSAVCLALALFLLAACSDGAEPVAELADDDAIFTVSYSYIRPSIHDDDIEGYCREHNFKQITKNDDGSYTFRQDRAAYEEKMADRRSSLITYLTDMLANEDYGAYVLSYDLDEDNAFRDVKLTVDSVKYLEAEDHSDLLGEYILSVYQYFLEDGEEAGGTIEFISESTGKVLNTVTFPQTVSSSYLY